MRFATTLSFLGALTTGMLTVSPAPAQTSGTEKPLPYIYNATWTVPRNLWADYQKMQANDDDLPRKFVDAKSGADSPGAVVRSTLDRALEKLLDEGALHAYSIDEEAVHSSDPRVLWVAIAANGAAGLDKLRRRA